MKKYRGKDGKVDMCKGLKDWLEEERQEGRSEGIKLGVTENTRTIVKNMLRRGMSDQDIMAITECEQKVIDEVRKKL